MKKIRREGTVVIVKAKLLTLDLGFRTRKNPLYDIPAWWFNPVGCTLNCDTDARHKLQKFLEFVC